MLRPAGFFLLASSLLAFTHSQAGSASPNPEPSLLASEQRLAELYRDFKDAVVKVKVATRSKNEAGDEQIALTVFSGFYIDGNGTVLTNAIPTDKKLRIRIEQNGVELLAVLIATDIRTNLSIVQPAKPPPNLSFIDIEPSEPMPEIGSLAYAITSPLDLGPTPKLGLVSGRESSFGGNEFPFTYTRVSIPSGPAEGGSPIFSTEGKLIGISVASLPDVNSSYVVPTKYLQRIVVQLKEKRHAIYPSLGATFVKRGNPVSMRSDVMVEDLKAGGAATRAGLKKGDRILQFEGAEIQSLNALRDAIFFSEPDRFVTLLVSRDDEQREITILLGQE